MSGPFKPQQSHSSQRSSKLLVRTCCRHGPSSWRKGCSYRERQGVLRDHGDVVNLTKGLIEPQVGHTMKQSLQLIRLKGRKPENVISCVHGETPSDNGTSFNDVSEMLSHRSRPCLGFLAISLKLIPMRCSISQATSVIRTRLVPSSLRPMSTRCRMMPPSVTSEWKHVPLLVRSASLGPAVRNSTTGFLTPGRGGSSMRQPRGLTPHEGARLQDTGRVQVLE